MSAESIALTLMLLNEEKGLSALLDSIEAQSLRPDEVAVCDNGSSDGTMQILKEWQDSTGLRVTLIERPGVNIATGRNIAIRATDSPIICVSDGSCILDREWVERITEPLRRGDVQTGIAYGVMIAIGATMIGRQFSSLHYEKTHGKDRDDFEHTGGSVAFSRSAWENVGGYPEWMSLAGEDTVFFKSVEKNFGSTPVPDAKVYWYHDENSLARIFRKHLRNSKGDGEANLCSSRYACLIGLYLVAVVGLALAPWFPVLLPFIALYLVAVTFRHTPALLRRNARLVHVLTVIPLITLFRDLGMAAGYLIGIQRRFTKKVVEPANRV